MARKVLTNIIQPCVCVVYLIICSCRVFKKKPVPNPSKYFCTLQSVYEGNLKVGIYLFLHPFKGNYTRDTLPPAGVCYRSKVRLPLGVKPSIHVVRTKEFLVRRTNSGILCHPLLFQAWLNPAEAFFTTQPIDGISPVQVCDVKACPPTSSVLASGPMQSASPDTDGDGVSSASSSSSSSSSFYTNIGYFLSSSSGSSAPATRGPAYFTYSDDGGNASITVSLFSSFGMTRGSESLEEEPQSPDSGFSFGNEDEAEKEHAEDAEEQICPLLVFPFQHPSPPPPLSPSHLSSGDSADGGSVCRSSSMNVQPCRTGYLTLKELHTTFSNKSI